MQQLLDVLLADLDERLRGSTKVVDLAGVDVEPEGVDVQLEPLQTLLQEAVTGDVLQLLQRVDLREFVLDGELVLRVDVSRELPQRRFALEEQRLREVC